ncbi:N-acetylmuramoyl-L-alanine amidase [Marinicauda algicola]|uniref:N-acetylmuramoyl-L-alanine amidase n=1 Tax=Marinicauda algicola TaxID=2029849 RepID=A0A4V3RYE9_9PROT|nr:N-acetylmuramoyl-L-alanine amidase [Marinicauda algicola]TGY89999.1 N-acetylmuramoyl-L-alanine amidase [Marinicauda algicola]
MKITETPSPNFNERKLPVSILVLHYTGMESGTAALDRLREREAGVSAHYMVEEDGEVFRLVAEDKRAWHAGVSAWRGIEDVNSASVGIEIVNGGHEFGLPPFPEAQIEAVIELCRDVMGRHGIAARDVVGHSDIAPARKADPGERFPWRHLAAAGVGLWPDPAGKDVAELMRIGAIGDPVEALQLDLQAIGYALTVDGEFGLAMEAVVKAFQRRFRPEAIDGIVDGETAGLIARVKALAAG